MNDYPECEKLSALADQMNHISEFLEHSGYVLCEYPGDTQWPRPVNKTISKIVHEYLELDENKLEQERQHMLANL